MGQMQQRIIAGSGALLFFISTIGLTVVIIMTMIQERNNQTPEITADPNAANACQAPASATETLPAPETFTVEGDVNELQSTDLEQGTGREAKAGDCLVMKYYGTLASNGEMFDENFTQASAFAFELGSGKVIPGWDEGLVGIKEGGTRRLVIPADKAYGEQSPSEKIPANSALVFHVKLLSIAEPGQDTGDGAEQAPDQPSEQSQSQSQNPDDAEAEIMEQPEGGN